MRAVTVSIFLLMFMVTVLTAIAQDYGTHIPVNLDESVKRSLWYTDWSPDGKWITFEVKDDIYVYNLENREAKNVTETVEEDCFFPCFTPDSQEVTFTLSSYVRNPKFSSYDQIEGINIYTGDRRLVMDDAFEGSWSQDGNYFIYSHWPSDGNLSYAIYDYDSDETTYYIYSGPDPPIFSFYPTCMNPDNTHFVATLEDNITRSFGDVAFNKLYSIDLDDGEPVQIDLGYGHFWYPEYSPDGTWLIYTQMTDNFKYSNVSVYNIETGEIIDAVPDSEFNTYTASWSPDGTQFCYILETDNSDELYIKDFEFASEQTSVSYAEETPVNFILHGNYPNPFNPTTTIEFSLPGAGYAELIIYNVMGQKIRELVSGTRSEGIHSVVWDGRNSSALPVSAGVYMSRLRMNDNVKTGRMTLVK